MATVGNPMPITPLMRPASKKTPTKRSQKPVAMASEPPRSKQSTMRKRQTQPSGWPKAGEWLIYGLMRLDLTDLRLVLNVAEAASITHGATRSGLSLAAASERIRDVEQALGVTLFERKRRGVSLTPAGQALIHHARVVTQQLELMRGELGSFAKGLRGSVRLLSNTAALQEFLPPWSVRSCRPTPTSTSR